MVSDILNLLALVGIGVVAGFLNVTAGGGSLLSLPFLIFLGLPPAAANGTNRIALLAQNIMATARFHQFKVIPKGLGLIIGPTAIAGSILGAQLAVDIDPLLFKRILALVMIGVMALTLFGPRRMPATSEPVFTGPKKALLALTFFGIGCYGGFIQGGIGFLLIMALTLAGYDLVRTNALKVLTVLIFTPFALGVFWYNGQVDFFKGGVLAIGNATGAWIASKVVVERGHDFIRWIVMAAVVIFAVKLFLG